MIWTLANQTIISSKSSYKQLLLLRGHVQRQQPTQLRDHWEAHSQDGGTQNWRSSNYAKANSGNHTNYQTYVLPWQWWRSNDEVLSWLRNSKQPYKELHCNNMWGYTDLAANLFARQMKESPACACGHREETIDHYMLRCPAYGDHRRVIKTSPLAIYLKFKK